MTDYLFITLYTSTLPASTSYYFELFDKYVSATDYARSVYVTGTISRNPYGSDTLTQSTTVQWRQQKYKRFLTGSGPIRITLNNNFEYVSVYNDTTNS